MSERGVGGGVIEKLRYSGQEEQVEEGMIVGERAPVVSAWDVDRKLDYINVKVIFTSACER